MTTPTPVEHSDRAGAAPAIRPEDPARPAALPATGPHDGPHGAAHEALDRLARLATRLLDVPVAVVSLVDDGQWTAAGLAGLDRAAEARGTPLGHPVCQLVAAAGAPVVVPDALADPRVRDDPAVREHEVRACAGVPLTTADGHTLGAFCAIDRAPRDWTSGDLEALRDLAAAAVGELALRATVRALEEQAATYRASVALSPQVPWTADAAGELVELSPRWAERTGQSAEASAGAGWADALHPEERERVLATWAHAVATGEPYDVEHRVRLADGSYRWVRSRARPQHDAAGRTVRWFGWSEDIHEQVLAGEEHARFALMARSAVDGLWSWEIASDRVFHAPRYRELLGYTAEEFGDSREAFYAVLHPDDREPLREAVRAHLTRRVPFDLEIRLRHKDGSWRWFWDRGQAEWDGAGRPIRMAGSVSDITDRRAAEAALRESEARYRALLRHYPDGAVFSVDHDLRLLVADGQALVAAGFDCARLVGRTLAEVLPRDSYEVLAPHYRAALAGEEHRFRLPSGERVFDCCAVPVRDDAGRVVAGMLLSRDVTEQHRAEAALRESEQRYALAARATSNAIWEWDPAADTLTWSGGVAAILGHADGGTVVPLAWWEERIHPEDRARVLADRQAMVARPDGETSWRAEYRFRRVDGSHALVLDRGYLVRDAHGRAVRMIGAMEDVSNTRALEAQLRQAQKMEAVGQLAGGIAHDFNNLLTVIAGNLEFVHGELPAGLPPEHPVHADLREIGESTERARRLVRQLLAFSRKQPVRPARLRLGEVVERSSALLRRLIGEEIALAVDVADASVYVEADASQLEQVLLNLAVNARDAMLTARHGHPGTGGTLTVEVDAVALDVAETRGGWDGSVAPGRWARLRVRDTGHGMDAETRAHLFEPFFTTKAVGQGTGLGLATVFGIVRQAQGAIRVDSVPGHGTTVTILLPAHDASTPAPGAHDAGAPAAPARGTVLLVEDEAAVRAIARRTLERRGYRVLEARHGADALLVWHERGPTIDVLVTDLRMPELGGRELVARLRAERPTLPVVFMSGYAEEAVAPADAAAPSAFVEKPFTTQALVDAVQGVTPAAGPRAPDATG